MLASLSEMKIPLTEIECFSGNFFASAQMPIARRG
jgi:hypothetical protein